LYGLRGLAATGVWAPLRRGEEGQQLWWQFFQVGEREGAVQAAGVATIPPWNTRSPTSANGPLSALPAFLARWFQDRLGCPTPVQRLAWSALASSPHLLISAPPARARLSPPSCPSWRPVSGRPSPGLERFPPAGGLYRPSEGACGRCGPECEGHLADLVAYLPSGCRPLTLASRTGDTPPGLRKQLHDTRPISFSHPRKPGRFAESAIFFRSVRQPALGGGR